MPMSRRGHRAGTSDEKRTTERWTYAYLQISCSGGVSLESGTRARIGWLLVAGLAVAWVLSMTLRPDSTPNTINLVPLREHARAVVCLLDNCPDAARATRFLFIDVAGNVVVFVPIGLALAGALGGLANRRRLWMAIALCTALSIGIELFQLTIPSRATDVDDVLFNTVGAALGALFIVFSQHWLNHNGE